MEYLEINFLKLERNKNYEKQAQKVVNACFKEENLTDKNLYVNIILTTAEEIKKINKKYRNINKETDVLSFPMFEKEELKKINYGHMETLGDIIISVEQVKKQAKEYGHGFQREFSYMIIHGFYHLLGFDHIEKQDKKIMREREEKILIKLDIK